MNKGEVEQGENCKNCMKQARKPEVNVVASFLNKMSGMGFITLGMREKSPVTSGPGMDI